MSQEYFNPKDELAWYSAPEPLNTLQMLKNSYAHHVARIRSGKAAVRSTKTIAQYNRYGMPVGEFKTAQEAAEACNGTAAAIENALSGGQRTAYGFSWRYQTTGREAFAVEGEGE